MDYLVNSSDKSESLIEDEDDIGCAALENEKCGICRDVVIDRGALDCCNHWFCFPCIDQWSAITNLCPLCKNEFQLITCLPVYDTLGSLMTEEHTFLRDDDWCIQGNNNTLSFPSYYIDEDAVKCLDGEKCKVRNDFATSDEDLGCDTSIACDSCDIWYHAFCVGFNPHVTSENSWLCPRCIANNVQENILSMQTPAKQSALNSSDLGLGINHSFSGKVSVSVADTGDTDVVVSIIKEQTMMDITESLSELKEGINADNEAETSMCVTYAGKGELGMQGSKSGCNELICSNLISSDDLSNANAPQNCSERTLDIATEIADAEPHIYLRGRSVTIPELQHEAAEMTTTQPYNNLMEASLPPSSSQDVDCYLSYIEAYGDSKANSTEKIIFSPSNITKVDKVPDDATENQILDSRTGCLDESYLSVDNVTDATVNEIATRSSTHPSEESSLSGDKMVTSTPEEQDKVKCQENIEVNGKKDMDKFIINARDVGHVKNHIRKRERGRQVKMEADSPAKKAKSDKKPPVLPSGYRVNSSDSEIPRKCSPTEMVSKDKLRYAPQKQDVSVDIMGVVQETDRRSHHGSEIRKLAGLTTRKGDDAAGVRMKKIMHQVGDRKETSMLVQKLRNEIREAVQDKSSTNTGKDDSFDANLLKAFRAAIVKPESEPCRKLDISFVKVRKQLLQKGKIRDNLTKKIYGTSSGRRRRAWDREREIDFWKYRCRRMKPEKVETLQSVLELLKKATNPCSENSEMDQGPEGDTENSFLSRVYLADASVLPRKDDIKPLSALTGSSLINNFKENKVNSSKNLAKKDFQAVHEKNIAKSSMGISKDLSQVSPSNAPGKRMSTSSVTDEGFSRNRNLDALKSGSTSTYSSSGSKGSEQNSKELTGQSDSGKNDKRQWALEVLARKNALMNPDASREGHEDAWLKGKYPLLAQLPTDMRPVLAPSRDKKFPLSVRQAQLNHITEHYLRRAALPVIHRTADTELAVADAINVENNIFENSKSKSVYTNLCSQFLSQLAKKTQSTETNACQSPASTAEGADLIVEETNFEPVDNSCSKVEEALKLAGLLDSPPQSQYTTRQDLHEEGEKRDNIHNCSKVEEALKLAGLLDSPPQSPYTTRQDLHKEGEKLDNIQGEAVESVLDTDRDPELDIFGDFEYDLEDEGHIFSSHSSALQLSKVQQENGESRMKVVLSTLKSKESVITMDSKHDSQKPQISEAAGNDHDNSRTSETVSDSSTVFEAKRDCSNGDARTNSLLLLEPPHGGIYKELSMEEYEELYGPDKETLANKMSDNEEIWQLSNIETTAAVNGATDPENYNPKDGATLTEFRTEQYAENPITNDRASFNKESCQRRNSPNSLTVEHVPKEGRLAPASNKLPDLPDSVSKKVEVYVKEHIRPLCKSGVITIEQYRWAVGKTTNKVMKYHYKAKNASFLIKEGEKVKRLAEQYVEAAQQKKLK